MASSLAVLCSGVAAILKAPVKVAEDDDRGPSISINTLFESTLPTIPLFPGNRAKEAKMGNFGITVVTLNGKRTSITVNPEDTMGELMDKIEEKSDISSDYMRMICNGKEIDTHDKKIAVRCTGLDQYCTIYLIQRLVGGGTSSEFCHESEAGQIRLDVKPYTIKSSELDSKYDFDFTSKADDGNIYVRGGYQYNRPYGWYRYAVKVVNEYDDDSWLGPDGIRTYSVPGEWPISYHGTSIDSAQDIVKDGFTIGPRGRHGRGVYSSPSVEMVAEKYSKEFKHTDGYKYKLVFQNRVNPAPGHLDVINKRRTRVGADYWLSPKQDPDNQQFDVRPYGILVRRQP